MSIITKPVVSKGVPAVFTLDKTALAAHPLVLADPYYSNLTNWNRIKLAYKSTVGSQSEILDFDASLASPTATFFVTTDSRDDFIVEKIMIVDFDGGNLQIPRSSLVVGEFDLALGTENFPSLPATFIKAYSANVTSPQNIENARLNPNSYGFDINYSVTKKMPTSDISLEDVSSFTDFNSQVNVVAKQTDGKILIGGDFTSAKGYSGINRFIRLNSDGTLDITFSKNSSENGKFSGLIRAIAVQSDGKILVGGDFSTYGGVSGRNYLVRLNSDGTVDGDFCLNAVDGNKISSPVYSIATQSDGKILVGGNFTNRLIRLNSDGTTDVSFVNNASSENKINNTVKTIAVQADGKILIGGDFIDYAGTSGRSGMVRFNSDGTLDVDFCVNAVDGQNLNPSIRKILEQSDGKILLGGSIYGNYSLPPFRRLNSDGTSDATFNSNILGKLYYYDNLQDLQVLSDGRILIGGDFSNYGGISGRSRLVCLNSDGTLDVNFTINSSDGSKFSSTVNFSTELSGNKIIIVGAFTNYGTFKNRNYVVVLNSDGTRDAILSDNISSKRSKLNTIPNSTAIQTDGKILIGGGFTDYEQVSGYNGLVRVNADGSLDTAFCENVKNKLGTVRVIQVQPNGQILVGGSFSSYDGVPNRNNLIRLNIDGTLDTFFTANATDGTKFSSTVNCIEIKPNGQILVGGSFSSYAGISGRSYLIQLNFDGTLDETFCNNATDGSKFNSEVKSISIQSDGKILVGGSFNTYAGTSSRNYLIRLNEDGTLDVPFCTNASDSSKFSNVVMCSKIQSDGKILIGGMFQSYGGVSGRNYLVRLNSDGTLDSAFCTNAVDGGNLPAWITTLVLYKNYIIVNLGASSSTGNLRFLDNDGKLALTGIKFPTSEYVGYLDYSLNAAANETMAVIPTIYLSATGILLYGILFVEIEDSSYSNAITYLGANGLPSTELGPTGVSLSATPEGQLQYTNDDIEGIITLNASLKPTP